MSARRLEEIFDEPGTGGADPAGEERARERWYQENRPPHHDSC